MLVLINATIVNEGETITDGYLVVDGETIAAVGSGPLPRCYADAETLDLEGRYLLPGAIDEHVHFREPGMTAKGDIASESLAAVAGGVTSFLEMPNTSPATTTIEAWQEKMDRAAETSYANYGFFLGATNDNIDTLLHADYTRIPGVKLFMGSSTGGMLVDSESTQRRIFSEVPALIAVHAESEDIIRANRSRIQAQYTSEGEVPLECHSQIRSEEACEEATYTAVRLASVTGARLHITHISTDAELRFFIPGDDVTGKQITAETCPQYLLFSDEDYALRGSRIKCNPAIKTAHDRDELRRAVTDGVIDTIATDHAPHLPADKQGDALTATSGMPGVQFSVPLMLDLYGPEMVVQKMAHNPALIFRIDRRGFLRPGYYADLVVLEKLPDPIMIIDEHVISRCGWTPYEGLTTHWRVLHTMVNGRWIMRDTSLIPHNRSPHPLSFLKLKT